jgi:hypothetical protein
MKYEQCAGLKPGFYIRSGLLRGAGTLDGVRETDRFQHPDEIPADVGLIPAQAEARGARVRVMVPVPVLAPGRQLEGAQPPDVHAGVALFDLVEMREAVYQTLHVQRIDQAHGAHPKEAHPAEAKNQADENREKNDRCFGPAPDLEDATSELGRPALLVGGLGLIEPAKMRPPEAALFGAGDILWRVGDGVVQAMIGDPSCGVAGTVEDRPEDQELLDESIGLESLMREQAMVADGGAQAAEGDEEQGYAYDLETRQREEDQPDHREEMNEDQISEDSLFPANGFPEGPIPRPSLLRDAKFHVISGDLPC